jgi:hypothetical protein
MAAAPSNTSKTGEETRPFYGTVIAEQKAETVIREARQVDPGKFILEQKSRDARRYRQPAMHPIHLLRIIDPETERLVAFVEQMSEPSSQCCPGGPLVLIGHITLDEFRSLFPQTEQANGFANRFLWCLAERSALLPAPGSVPKAIWDDLVQRTKAALTFAGQVRSMQRDAEATILWHNVYSNIIKRQLSSSKGTYPTGCPSTTVVARSISRREQGHGRHATQERRYRHGCVGARCRLDPHYVSKP